METSYLYKQFGGREDDYDDKPYELEIYLYDDGDQYMHLRIPRSKTTIGGLSHLLAVKELLDGLVARDDFKDMVMKAEAKDREKYLESHGDMKSYKPRRVFLPYLEKEGE